MFTEPKRTRYKSNQELAILKFKGREHKMETKNEISLSSCNIETNN
jgi:hypothetical protein